MIQGLDISGYFIIRISSAATLNVTDFAFYIA